MYTYYYKSITAYLKIFFFFIFLFISLKFILVILRMLRVSFFTRQVSKRLASNFTATNSVIGASGAKQKTRSAAKDLDNSTNVTLTSSDIHATATTALQSAAVDGPFANLHGGISNTQDGSATGVLKKLKKMKKKSLQMAIDDGKICGEAAVPPDATSPNGLEKTSAFETRVQKEDEGGNSYCDSRSPQRELLTQKNKKKKLSKTGLSRLVSDRTAKEESSALACDTADESFLSARQMQAEHKQQQDQQQILKPQQAENNDEEGKKRVNVETSAAAHPSVISVPSEATSFCSAVNQDKETFSQQKTAMIKAFRIEDVLSACSPNDGVFARRLPQGGCQFFAWPGTPLAVASNAVATMPDTIRTVHAIFGRAKTPIDLVLDIDCPVPQEHWSTSKARLFQRKLLDDVLTVVVEELKAIGEKIATQVVLQSPNLKKASFHVHTKLQDAAFEDYNSLHGFLYSFHKKIPSVDLQIYRQNGMLRMHRCMKENHTSAICVFDDKKWNIGFPNGLVPDHIAAVHSACVREAGTYSRLLRFETPRCSAAHDITEHKSGTAHAAGETKGPVVLLPRTEREAVESAAMWLRTGSREADVAEWRSWIGLGINAYRVAYHFRDAQTLKRPAMEELLEAWVEASKKCPAKFRQGTCESKWASFDITRLSKLQESDWWPSYLYIGRMAMRNEAADAAHLKLQRR